MFMRKTTVWLSLILLVTLALAACGGEEEDDSSTSGSQSRQQLRQLNATQETPADDPASTPDFPEGTLVYMQGERLYALSSADAEPRLLLEDVMPESLRISDDGQHMLYTTAVGEQIYAYDRETGSTQPVYTFGTWEQGRDDYQVIDWSPDSDNAILRMWSRNAYVLINFSQSEHYFMDTSLANLQVLWLDNGGLVYVGWEDQGGRIENSDIYYWIPEGNLYRTIDLANEEFNPESFVLREHPTVQEFLEQNEAAIIEPNPPQPRAQAPGEIITPESYRGPSTPCLSWEIHRAGGSELLYSTEAFRLSDAAPLADGGMVFLEWRLPDCRLGFPTILLQRLYADGTLETITDEVFPGFNQYEYDSERPRRFLLTPDGQHIIWLGGDMEERIMQINLFDTSSNRNRLLTESQRTAGDTYFAQEEMLTSLHWLQTGPATSGEL